METLRVEVIVWNSPLEPELVLCRVEDPTPDLSFFSFFSGERFGFFNAGRVSSPSASVTADCLRFFE